MGPRRLRVVVVGLGPAGAAAARHAASGGGCTVTVFEKRSRVLYDPRSIPDAVAGLVELDALAREAPLAQGVEVRTSTLVEEVDTSGRVVRARDLRTGERLTAEYDALVLATGSKPRVPRDLRVEDSAGVFTLKTLEDAREVIEAAGRHGTALVVGGGVLGVEAAYALARRGVKVALVERCSRLVPRWLDPEIAREVEVFLRARGVDLVLGSAALEISGEAGAKRVVCDDGRVLEAGFVVVATGVAANVELARRMGLELGASGGVRVNEFMEASAEGVYAAGCVAEVKDFLTGKPALNPFVSAAYVTGRVAGLNAAGGSVPLRGVLRCWIANLGGFKFGAVGLTDREAREAGFDVVSATVTAREGPPLYPSPDSITLKLLADGNEGRILGVQAAGEGNVVEKLNLVAAVIAGELTAEDLLKLGLAHAPSLSDLRHPLQAAAEELIRSRGRGSPA